MSKKEYPYESEPVVAMPAYEGTESLPGPGETVTEEGTHTISRGQHQKTCPTKRLPLFSNFSGEQAVTVAGDLKVENGSCTVRLVWGNGLAATFPAGTNIGIAVPLQPNTFLSGECIPTEGSKVCKWSFTRTSP